jgi:hypothetical protein
LKATHDMSISTCSAGLEWVESFPEQWVIHSPKLIFIVSALKVFITKFLKHVTLCFKTCSTPVSIVPQMFDSKPQITLLPHKLVDFLIRLMFLREKKIVLLRRV